uniref:Cytochrome C n=1 Tax=Caldimicrobium thiodismutans TaxID=1653476 RepID=A0A832LY20_9BACT
MYPIWEVPVLSAGFILGIIATFHVLPSHLSTSAMWFNVFIETKAYRENRPELLEFIKKYALLLLVFSYVTGTLSGIGIWFSATVASPRAISGLIHNYVWGWATEWVFFIIEVLGIMIYYYTLGKVAPKIHLKLGWIFAIGSWTTMVIIVGILAFMLSPGKWVETGGFFDGFFNQTYFPQLLMRSAFMFAVAGVYAIAVASTMKNQEAKRYIMKMASLWGIGAMIAGILLFFLYLKSLPAHNRELLSVLNISGLKTTILVSLVIILLYFIWANLKPESIKLPVAVVAIIIIFAGIFSTERIREMIRKPYIFGTHMYSNQFAAKDITAKGVTKETDLINTKGVLNVAPFVPENLRVITDQNKVQAGKMIALIECSACHAIGDSGLRPLKSFVKRIGLTDEAAADAWLEALGNYPYMPPFMGTPTERQALAAYLATLAK